MQDLLLLHGAIGSSAQLSALANELRGHYNVHLVDFPGHGGSEMPGEFSIPLFANSVLDYMRRQQLETVSIFGYSMGGYVGLYLARHFPAKVERIATLATKFEWSPEIAAKEIKMLQPETIEQKLPAFAALLKERHQPADWKQVLRMTAEMMAGLGKKPDLRHEDFIAIRQPVQLMAGDRDKMVSIEETLNVYRSLPAAGMVVLPSTNHPLEQVDISLLFFTLRRFFKN